MKLNKRGFTLVEVSVAIAVAALMSVAAITISSNMDSSKKRIVLVNTLVNKKMYFESLLASKDTFENTKNAAVNTGLQCLRDRTACPASQVGSIYTPAFDRIMLFDSSPAPGLAVYDGRAGHSTGFTGSGTECSGFVENGPGNDDCPIGYIVNWYLNSVGSAEGVRLTLNLKLVYNPSDKDSMKMVINKNSASGIGPYDVTVTRAMESIPNMNVATCQLNGITVYNGSIYPFFFGATAPAGQTCSAENRLCTVVNGVGTLSGSATNPTCVQNCSGHYDTCTASCGGGTQTYIHDVEKNQWGADCAIAAGATRACGTNPCAGPIDCQGSWGSCSVGCGGGTQVFNITTPASNGGAACPVSPQACNTTPCSAPVNCQGNWSSCSVSCGGGTRLFTVTTPAANGGAACPVSPEVCNTTPCSFPVNCQGNWSGTCTGTCGGPGTENYIVTVPPSGGGTACPVSPRGCTPPCSPVNCQGSWGACAGTCGGPGTESFNISVAPANGGLACPNSPRACTPSCAPVNCQGYWGSCTGTCGGAGSQTFTVTTPAAYGGAACPASPQSCTPACSPVNCAGTWDACSATCGGGTQNFTVTTPAAYGGAACPSSPIACNTQPCPPVDCAGFWDTCTAPCGGGTQSYTVTTPASNGGAACPTSPRACNTTACPPTGGCHIGHPIIWWGTSGVACVEYFNAVGHPFTYSDLQNGDSETRAAGYCPYQECWGDITYKCVNGSMVTTSSNCQQGRIP